MGYQRDDMERGKFDEVDTGQKFSVRSKAVTANGSLVATDNPQAIQINSIKKVSGQDGIDAATNTLQTITYDHHEIHSGSHYYIADSVSLGNGENIDLTIETPDTAKWAHIVFEVQGQGELLFEIFEGADYDADGTLTIPHNSNRNSTTTSVLTIRTNPTVNSDGTAIFRAQVGANRVAGSLERDTEIVLKQATKYIFRVTNQTALDDVISWQGEWYEHTNKN